MEFHKGTNLIFRSIIADDYSLHFSDRAFNA